MKDMALVLASLRARGVNTLLSVLLTAFGVMMAVLILMVGHHVQQRLSADGQGIDLVLGAKGSPLQIILSSVYHVDIPTGNIPYAEAEKWMKHPQVKSAIPLALGDNYRGFRIVGTTADLVSHYKGEWAEGKIWDAPFEAVVGADVGLPLGAMFEGAHGLVTGGHVHAGEQYTVVGVLKPTSSVLDRLIITSMDSVLEIHGHEGVDHEHHGHDHGHDHVHEKKTEKKEAEITAALLTLKSPIAAMNLPPKINRESNLQAANPALEMVRLSAMLGLGSRSFTALAIVLIVVAGLSIFAGLAGNFQNRAFDLALLRSLGYGRGRLMRLIVAEGVVITVAGLALGLALAYGGFAAMIDLIPPLKSSGASLDWAVPGLGLVVFSVVLAGLLSAMLPAWRAARLDVADQLAKSK